MAAMQGIRALSASKRLSPRKPGSLKLLWHPVPAQGPPSAGPESLILLAVGTDLSINILSAHNRFNRESCATQPTALDKLLIVVSGARNVADSMPSES